VNWQIKDRRGRWIMEARPYGAQAEADAILISAAPDYHAAAEQVFAQDLTGETVLISRAAWDALTAAHAKAEGRS